MSMLMHITLFYIIVVLQHLYFNNKTSSVHTSSINASESLSDSSSLRAEFQMCVDWSSYLSVFFRRISVARSSSHYTVIFMGICIIFENFALI